ncbi:MAG: M48 family metallopeptidase, partial [Muribaculaceae bacterium]|nr:M48 family metallopeptidase [Muribaculaceae bacterium]
RYIKHIAKNRVNSLLIPEMVEITEGLGLMSRVNKISATSADAKLGSCSSRGEILLSHKLVFLTTDLRRAIMTHELAHLDHMNHSEAFYARWEQLYGAPVKPLRRVLRSVPYPYPR